MSALFAFLHHLTAFALVAAIAVEFVVIRGAPLKQGQLPVIDEARLRAIRRIVHWELAGIVLILLCAALMARGIGQLG